MSKVARYDTPEKKAAHAAEQKRYRARHPERIRAIEGKWRKANPEGPRRRGKRWVLKNPDGAAAHKKLRWALISGKLIKPELCARCSKPGRIEGHHPDYSKPLEVEWLCKSCHTKETLKTP